MTLHFGVLGPLEVRRDGDPIDLGAPKQRAVMARLLLSRGRVVSADRLVDVVWGDEPPPSALPSLQVYVSNLRRLLRGDGGVSPLVRRSPGYLLDASTLTADVDVFEDELARATRAQDARDWEALVEATSTALGEWRGEFLADLRPADWVEAEAVRLDDQHVRAEELHVEGLLGTGRVTAAAIEARSLARRYPLRDDAARLHALALHRSGRTPDALDELREHVSRLDGELGLEPSTTIRDLQTALVRQDPWTSRWPASVDTSGPPVTSVPEQPAEARVPGLPGDRRTFVGRDEQLSLARTVVDGVRAGSPAWLVITGPAGIGKTRLAEQVVPLLGRAGTDVRVVRSRGAEQSGAPAWWVVRQLVADLGGDPADVLQVPSGAPPDTARFEVYERVRALLEQAGSRQPLVVIVDDLQWADETSLRTVSYLAGAMDAGRVLVVVTVRDNEGGEQARRTTADVLRVDESRHVVVPPLSVEEVVTLESLVTGESIDPAEARVLTARTGGNALFVTEYARLSAEERRGGQVPLVVRGVLERRLGVLDDDAMRVLRAAAVAGDVLELDLLEAVTGFGRDELLDVLEGAVDEEIVVPRPDGSGYAFSHALLRDTVLAGISPVRRQQAHLRVAAALATGSGERLTRRAQHLLAARPLTDPRELLDACRSAALLAEQDWSAETAVRWWQRAQEAFDLLPADQQDQQERDDLMVARLDGLARSGQGSTVIEVVGQQLTDAVRRGRPATVGRLAAALLRAFGTWPWVAFTSDETNVELAHRLAGLEDFVSDDAAATARTLAAAAVGLCYEDDQRVFDDLGRRALAVAETTGDPDVVSDALLARMLAYIAVTDHAAETDGFMQRLLDLPRARVDSDRAIAHSARVMSLSALGDVDGAEEQLRKGIAACDRYRIPVVRVQLRWSEVQIAEWRSGPLAARGLLDAARETHARVDLYDAGYGRTAETGLRWSEGSLLAHPPSTGLMEPLVWDAVVAAETGDVDRVDSLVAARLARPGTWIWATHGHLVVLAHTVADLSLRHHAASLLELVGRGAGTLALLGQGQILGPTDLALARLHDLLGHEEDARTLARAARDLCLRNDNPRWAEHCEQLTSPHTSAVRAALRASRG